MSAESVVNTTLPRPNRSHLKDQVTDIIRDYIIRGQIPPGTKLAERTVADMLGVSRAPVRDAFIQLEKEGLVVSRRDARYVIELHERDIEELFQVRTVLEKLAAELAAKNNSPSNRQALLEMVQTMRDAIAAHDAQAYATSDVELHKLIWKQADNRHLQKTLSAMSGSIFMFVAKHAEHYDWEETLRLHEDLVAKIIAGDPEAASASMEEHMENARGRALYLVRQSS